MLVKRQVMHVIDLPVIPQHVLQTIPDEEELNIAEMRDDLTSHLALREFDEAVELFQKCISFTHSGNDV